MIHDELIYQFATTKNEQEAQEILFLIVAHFINLYDVEKNKFSADNNVVFPDETTSYDKIQEDYAIYFTDLLLGMRDRILEKERELKAESDLDKAEFFFLLHKFVSDNYKRLSDTETVNVRQIAQLQVVFYVQSINSAAKVYKRWVAHASACEICKALDGTIIPISEPFLVSGQVIELSDGKEFIYNYIDREVAIAHPNDQCSLEFFIEY